VGAGDDVETRLRGACLLDDLAGLETIRDGDDE
jgi:hypothetical protein